MPNAGTVTVRGSVTVASAFDAVTPGTLMVGGTLYSNGARAPTVHCVAIHGGVNVSGSGRSMNCGSTGLFGGPFFGTFEDTTIGGTAVIRGVHSCWPGSSATTSRAAFG